jgi:hypothetical protein
MPDNSANRFSGLQIEDRPKWSKPSAGPEPFAARAVAKGANNTNVLNYDPPREYFAFLYQNETTGSDGPWILRFEAIEAEYFRVLWKELRAAGGEQLEKLLADVLKGGRYYQAFAGMTDEAKHLAYTYHMEFMLRLQGDPGPVSLIEAMVSQQYASQNDLVEGDWFLLRFGPPTPLNPLRNPEAAGEVLHAEIGQTPEADGSPTLHRLQGFEPVGKNDPTLNNILQALHFPQGDPYALSPEESIASGSGSPESPQPTGQMAEDGTITITGERGVITIKPGVGASFTPRSRGNGGMKRAAADPPDDQPQAQRQALVLPVAPPPAAPLPLPAPVAAPAPVAGANPMLPVANGVQPLVGVNSVGAGNNVALWSCVGTILAYHDYGYPTVFNQNTHPGPPYPCVCDDPVIVLSHWDYDHYAMVRFQPEATRRRWIAPQQPMGSVACRELYIRILQPGGGVLQLWPLAGAGPAPGYVIAPFGFIERANGAPVNDDGLVLYVRVSEAPPPLPPLPPPPALPPVAPIFAPRAAPVAGGIAAPLGRSWMVLTAAAARQNDQAIDPLIPAPFRNMIVVPALPAPLPLPGLGLALAAPGPPLTALPAGTPAGTAINQPIGLAPAGAMLQALWIPPAGVALPAGAGNYLPPAPPGGGPTLGGWALLPADYVRMGGFILDIPRPGLGHDGRYVVSPTPDPAVGSPWRPPPGFVIPPVFPIMAVIPAAGIAGWQPVWGAGLGPCYEVALPPGLAPPLPPPVPLPLPPALVALNPGPAPIRGGDVYILLPGDAGTSFIPTQAGGAPPTVAAFVATHHGSEGWMVFGAAGPPAVAGANFIPAAPALLGAVAQDKIVFSYGVRPAGTHCYRNAAGWGHPRPAALAEYLLNAWGTLLPPPLPPLPALPPPPAMIPPIFHRLNTALSDLYSLQPDNPLGLAAGLAHAQVIAMYHRNGDIAIGWDAGAGGPLWRDYGPAVAAPPLFGAQPQINRTCLQCGFIRNFCY